MFSGIIGKGHIFRSTKMFSAIIAKGHLFRSFSRMVLSMFQVQLEKGIYFVQLQEWFRVFPRDQIMILRLEDYTRHRTQTVLSIYKFLDFSKFITESLCVKNVDCILVSVQAGFKQFDSATEAVHRRSSSVGSVSASPAAVPRLIFRFIEKQFHLPLVQKVRVVSCWRKWNVHLI